MIKKGLAGFILLAMLFTALPVYAGAQGTAKSAKIPIPQYNRAEVGTVSLENDGQWVITGAELDGVGPRRLFLTVELRNHGSAELNLKDYWMYLYDTSGGSYPVKLLDGASSLRVSPQRTGSFTFYAEVSDKAEIGDFTVRVIRWNFDKPELEDELAVLPIQASYSTAIPEGTGSRLAWNNMDVVLRTGRVALGSVKENVPVAVYLDAENVGRTAVDLTGQFEFAIESQSGQIFVLKSDSGKTDKKLAPNTQDTLRLSGNLPARSLLEGASLVVKEPGKNSASSDQTTSAIRRPLARLMLPKPEGSDLSAAKTLEFSTEDGVYVITLEQVRRVPWEDKDLLQTAFTLRAKGEETLPVPKLSGFYLLDDNVKVEASFGQTEGSVGVSRRTGASLFATGAIPYLFDPDKTGFVLEYGQDGEKEEVARFERQPVNPNLPVTPAGQSYRMGETGKTTGYTIKRIYSYYNGPTRLLVAQVEAVNTEKRVVRPGELTGYLQLADETMYPVEIGQSTEKVSAGGKQLLNVRSLLPGEADLEKAVLILGPKGKTAEGSAKTQDWYVSPVTFELPVQAEPALSFRNMSFAPYELDMSNYVAKYDYFYGEWTFGIDYDLKKDPWVQAETKDYRIWVQIEDYKGNVVYEERLELENENTADALYLGKHTYQFKRLNRDTLNELKGESSHKLKVYAVYQGYKRLLAQREVTSFTNDIKLF